MPFQRQSSLFSWGEEPNALKENISNKHKLFKLYKIVKNASLIIDLTLSI